MNKEKSLDNLPALGVGITYSSAVEPLIVKHPQLLDVLEIEPQTSWMEQELGSGIFKISDPVLAHIAQLPGKKLVHSISMPVGTSKEPDPHQLSLLNHTIQSLRSPWMSEHLSFNNGHDFFTGFFLPPRQTETGVQLAIDNINKIQKTIPVPLAIETGVNYFRTRKDEMPDGAFVGQIAKEANCGILLDLHNLWTNQLNGRQSIDHFLYQIPLDQVIEIHLAGGMEVNGFWLDAHSGAIPKQLLTISQEIIHYLPNLKAIIFEVFPSFIPLVGLEMVREQIEQIKDLWNVHQEQNQRIQQTILNQPKISTFNKIENPGQSVADWERAIGRMVTGQSIIDDNVFFEEYKDEPGIDLIKSLIKEFRGSMLVAVLKLSSRFLMLTLGPDVFRAYLEDFWSKFPPNPLASTEAARFGEYMKAINLAIPNFNEILAFELAVLATLIDEKVRVVTFERNPLPLIKSLAEGKLPSADLTPGEYEIEITPDGPIKASGLSLQELQEFFPNH